MKPGPLTKNPTKQQVLPPQQSLVSTLELALQLYTTGQLAKAEKLYFQILKTDPDQPVALHMLGIIAHQVGKIDIAVNFIMKALVARPDFIEAYNNLGNMLQEQEKLDDALTYYDKALAIKPDFIEALYNRGTVLQRQKKLREAVASYHAAINLNPDYAEAHNNLGTALQDLGELEDSITSYHMALNLKSDYPIAWNGLKISEKANRFLQSRDNHRTAPLTDKLNNTVRATTDFAIHEYYLTKGKPFVSYKKFQKAMASLPALIDGEISLDEKDQQPAKSAPLSKKVVALLHFGRSGTGLLHSLIDDHPEISTVPSIYLRGFFNAGVWNKIAAKEWHNLPARFIEEFAVLFDANSPKAPPGRLDDDTPFLGKNEGMASVGENRDEILSLDRDKFYLETLQMIKSLGKVDPSSFFQIIHAAYDKITGAKNNKHTILYHIHNPDDFAKLNFIQHTQDARFILMVREPVQCCESWIRVNFQDNNYGNLVHQIITMLFAFDQDAFRMQKSIGIRLEDLKTRPEETMRSLCTWLGIKETPSLYQMTAQGKKWWGDPTSPDYSIIKEMSPFDTSSIKRTTGTIFSDKDQFILQTLYYPFCVRFGYTEPDPVGFEKNLKEILPMFDDMLDFEEVMLDRANIKPAQFKHSANYILLRASFKDRWDILNEYKDYPNMITPLNIT